MLMNYNTLLKMMLSKTCKAEDLTPIMSLPSLWRFNKSRMGIKEILFLFIMRN